MSLDDDLDQLTLPEAIAELKKIRAMIREHRDASGHDLCWYWPEL